jgi:murein DD-endopeptidase MepM/ murein hydrolase activator NlpD
MQANGPFRNRAVTRVAGVLLAIIGLVMAGPPAAAAPSLSSSIAARSMRPGELAVLAIGSDVPLADVHVEVFERRITAYALDATHWRALIGIDLDQAPGNYVAVVDAATDTGILHVSQALSVQPRTFRTRTLRVAPDFVNPSPSLLARIEQEQAFTRGVYAVSADVRLWSAPFIRPVPQAANSRFGTRSVFNGEPRSPHGGTDFLSPAGTPIKAPNAGRVVAARNLFFTGNTVIVDHGLGLFSLFAHLSRLDVREGEQVIPGQIIGLVGATGRVTGPHLHWALSVSGARVDPLSLLALLGAMK